MTTVDFVELELGDDSWKITWDVSRRKKIKTTGEKYGLKYTIYSLTDLTPAQAYDIAMVQLEWLKKDLSYVI
tara:strand:+ start:113 stop:328 length:216 start_codon:yes stop_codon:yes gene_type:complete